MMLDYWRERGRGYEAKWRRTPAFSAQERLLAELLRRFDFRTVLDVGCGFGRIGQLILTIRPVAYTGLDVSPHQLDAARRRIPGGVFIEGTLGSLAPDLRFDLVIAAEVLMHQPPDEAAEMAATMRRLGRHVITVDWEAPGAESGGYQWGHDYAALFPGATGIPVGQQAVWHWTAAA